MSACPATLTSTILPGHVHTCATDHAEGDHVCADRACRRWFGVS